MATGASLGILAAALIVLLFAAALFVESRRIRRDADRNVEKVIANAARERETLLDRIMHLSGSTWVAPPILASGRDRDEPPEEEIVHVRHDVESFVGPIYGDDDIDPEPARLVYSSKNGNGAL